MKIYVESKDMPKAAEDCLFYEIVPLRPYPYCHAQIGKSCGFPNNCPLVPVPPHGRLGDLEKLALEMMDAANEDQALAMLDDAPTIIPASEDGEI